MIEERSYGDGAADTTMIQPLIPTNDVCLHDPKGREQEELACTECKLNVHLSLKVTPQKCLALGQSGKKLKRTKKEKAEAMQPAFFPGNPESSNIVDRCLALVDKINLMISQLMPTIRSKTCECLGCCTAKDPDATCFFPYYQVL
jgi:hypothetical protein